MILEIKLFAGLKCSNPELPCFGENDFQLEVPDGMTIGELRGILGIAPAIPLLTIVNNHHEQEDWTLKDNDRVGIFPPSAGDNPPFSDRAKVVYPDNGMKKKT